MRKPGPVWIMPVFRAVSSPYSVSCPPTDRLQHIATFSHTSSITYGAWCCRFSPLFFGYRLCLGSWPGLVFTYTAAPCCGAAPPPSELAGILCRIMPGVPRGGRAWQRSCLAAGEHRLVRSFDALTAVPEPFRMND